MTKKSSDTMLDGISTTINNRHAFVHERMLELIVSETQKCGSTRFNKSEMAKSFGCSIRSIDRAVHRLRTRGCIETTPVFSDNGAQSGNEYRATQFGIDMVNSWR